MSIDRYFVLQQLILLNSLIVSPDFGAVRRTSATVSPPQSTTYTLYATNAFGRTIATVNITVN
jgi:hypothetical protein